MVGVIAAAPATVEPMGVWLHAISVLQQALSARGGTPKKDALIAE